MDALGARHVLSSWAGKDELRRGLVGLWLARVFLPSYDFIRRYRPCALLSHTQLVVSRELALSAFAGDRTRGWAIAVGAALHVAIAVVLGLVSFGMTTMVGLLCVSALLRDRRATVGP
jgi:hypothetical protein